MLDPIIASALECKTCSRTIYKTTTRCAKVLATKIEEAITKLEVRPDGYSSEVILTQLRFFQIELVVAAESTQLCR